MGEFLQGLTRKDLQGKLKVVEPTANYEDEVFRSLSSNLISQPEACKIIARQVNIFDAGLSNPQRPIAVDFWLGNPGTGKSETGRALASHLFNNPNSPQLKYIDCAEYADSHSVFRLIGSPPSYVGYGDEGVITPRFLNSRNIIVFDEIEKAHPQLHRLLLSVMENGRLASRESRGGYHAEEIQLNFANSFIFFTSNIGSEELERAKKGGGSIGFKTPSNTEGSNTNLTQIGKEALKKHFSHMPEFVDRLDAICVFKPLNDESYNQIYWKFIDEINIERAIRDVSAPYITTTQEFKDHIIGSLDKNNGARELRRTIYSELLGKLANLCNGCDLRGRPIVADYEEGNVVFYSDDAIDVPQQSKKPIEEPKTYIIPVSPAA